MSLLGQIPGRPIAPVAKVKIHSKRVKKMGKHTRNEWRRRFRFSGQCCTSKELQFTGFIIAAAVFRLRAPRGAGKVQGPAEGPNHDHYDRPCEKAPAKGWEFQNPKSFYFFVRISLFSTHSVYCFQSVAGTPKNITSRFAAGKNSPRTVSTGTVGSMKKVKLTVVLDHIL